MDFNIPQIVIDDIRAAISENAKLERDRSLIDLDAFASMRDVDLLVEDIESGLLTMVEIQIPGSNQIQFILGYDGFQLNEDWVLG